MSKEVAVLATVAAGELVAAQAPANVLSERIGTWAAVSVNFIVGTTCVLTITFALAGGFGAGGVRGGDHGPAGAVGDDRPARRARLDERAVLEKLLGTALLAAGTVLVVRE